MDLRIARIVSAGQACGSAAKLLRLQLDIGEVIDSQPRLARFCRHQVRLRPGHPGQAGSVMVANLAPHKMKFGLSEAWYWPPRMPAGETPGLFILSPDAGAAPGMRVK